MELFICKKCGLSKPRNDFREERRNTSGLAGTCRACWNARTKNWRFKNIERLKIKEGIQNEKQRDSGYTKRYYLTHKEDLVRAAREAYLRDKEAFLRRSKEQKERLGERYKEYLKEYRKKNRLELNAKMVARLHSDPVFKLKHSLRNRFRKLIRGQAKRNSVLDLIGCSVEDLKLHIEKQWLVGMTWENWGALWHIDHRKPCAAFDLTVPSELALCWHYSNLQPLFAVDNLRKGSKYSVCE